MKSSRTGGAASKREAKIGKDPELVAARERLMAEVKSEHNPRNDTSAVIRCFKLPKSFPPAVLAEAERAASKFDASTEGRLDLRDKFIFTCDPESAKDFDDALSLEKDSRGRRILGVHIADVSHFVTPGSALDREAAKRSTSVYLADRVVPMLPEALSNGVCSLNPGEDRYAFSVFIVFDDSGRPVKRSFARSLIRSKARFAYPEVMDVIAGRKSRIRPSARRVILAVHALAQQLRKARYAAGALNMEVPELEVELDASGLMTGLKARVQDESHQLVEQCMIAANVAVATELKTRGIRILSRLHEGPDPDRLEELRADLARLGVRSGDLTRPRGVAEFLARLSGPLKPMITQLVLRSLKRACYDAKKTGHFGLAAPYYAHFTSPIRRYPDLVVHRQLADLITGGSGRIDQKSLDRAAANATAREQLADEAERALVELKKFRFLDRQLATREIVDYDAVVARCVSYGAFVDIPEIGCYGLVHVSRLAGEYVNFDPVRGVLYSQSREWKTGDRMKVRVERVDFAERHADFVPSEFKRARPPLKFKPKERRG